MNRKALSLLVLVGIIIGVAATFFFNPKDSWVCDNGQWVRKGSPKTSQPTTPCDGKSTTIKLPTVPPESVVMSFYTWVQKEDASAYTDGYKESKYLASSYKKELDARKDKDTNPFVCSSKTLDKFLAKKTTLAQSAATIELEQNFPEETKTAIVHVQAAGDKWEITNITCKK